MKGKKGIQLNQAFGAVLTIVLIAILVIVAIILFVSIGDSVTDSDTVSVTNETLTSNLTDIPQFVAQSPTVNDTLCSYNSFVVSVAHNATGGEAIPVTNITTTADGSIAIVIPSEYNNTQVNVTYTALWGGDTCIAANNLVGEFGSYTSLIGLVGTIIFLGLVIGVLVASFVFRRKGV